MVNVFIPYGDFTVEQRGKSFVVMKKGKVIFKTRNKDTAVALAKRKDKQQQRREGKKAKRNWRK